MQFFKPENYFMVREALLKAGRGDLIGNGCDCLIPSQPPKAAIEARRQRANEVAEGDHYHTVANPAKGARSRRARLTESGLPAGADDGAPVETGREKGKAAGEPATVCAHRALANVSSGSSRTLMQ